MIIKELKAQNHQLRQKYKQYKEYAETRIVTLNTLQEDNIKKQGVLNCVKQELKIANGKLTDITSIFEEMNLKIEQMGENNRVMDRNLIRVRQKSI